MKNNLLHGLLAGLMAGIASMVYNNIYCKALVLDYAKVVNNMGLITSCVIGCLLAAVGNYYFSKFVKNKSEIWFNIIFAALTFASFVGPFATTLPNTIEAPELFIGLTIPMHLFPILFWLVTKPLFNNAPNEIV
jgi:uncharacterized membrane protein